MIVVEAYHSRFTMDLFEKAWASFDGEGRKSRGILSLMRRHACNLRPEQIPKLNDYFAKHPGLREVYDFKQGLTEILLKKRLNQRDVKELIPQFPWHFNELLQSPFMHLKTFGETLKSWAEAITRMWKFTKNIGITEGLHTKRR